MLKRSDFLGSGSRFRNLNLEEVLLVVALRRTRTELCVVVLLIDRVVGSSTAADVLVKRSRVHIGDAWSGQAGSDRSGGKGASDTVIL